MIKIENPADCCGCGACVDVCPKRCINMQADEAEGFKYAVADPALCIDCSLCDKICPVKHQLDCNIRPEYVCAYKNPDKELRLRSSSGGAFSSLSRTVISDGGVVYGAIFAPDFRSVVTAKAETENELAKMRGAKYMQSSAVGSYDDVYRRLKMDSPVLYSGTPCQIKALILFLKAKNAPMEKLLTVDVVCHGVPSDEAFREYLKWRKASTDLDCVNFRNELPPFGWKNYAIRVSPSCKTDIPGWKDLYMRSFIGNVNLRSSCYHCPAKGAASGSDITLGDFWGYPGEDDNSGVSLIIPRTDKGWKIVRALGLDDDTHSYSVALAGNPSIECCVEEPMKRSAFWRQYKTDFKKAVEQSVGLPHKPSAVERLKSIAYAIYKKLK